MNRALKVALVAGAGLAAAALLNRPRAYSFRDKVVLVTGGSRGLGLVLARQLAAEGAKLALVARNREDLGRAAASLDPFGVPVLTLPTDIRDKPQVETAIRRTVRHYGRLDILINNAGIIQVGPLPNMALRDFDNALATHFWGPLYAMRAAIPYMKRQGGGRIVNIASIGGKVAVPHLAPYSASKFALVGLSDSFRAEYARDNIQITTVCPWLVRTGSYRNVEVKGQHQKELVWFALGDSLPLVSQRDDNVAKRILEACRQGAPRLVLSPLGKGATVIDAVLPQLSAAVMAAAGRLLPDVGSANETKRGFESFSRLVPSGLTALSDAAAQRNNQLQVAKRRR